MPCAKESINDLEKYTSSTSSTQYEPSLPPQLTRTARTTFSDTANRHSISLLSGPTTTQPAVTLPTNFRTLSIQVTDTRRGTTQEYKGKKDIADLSTLEYHTKSVSEVCSSLGVDPIVGLDKSQANRRLEQYGKNQISRPKSNLVKKVFWYFFGGFGSLLFLASAICFISWKPLGDPNPQASNLALAIVLFCVLLASATFNAWQDYSTGRVMASISGMLPSAVLVIREGDTFELPASELVRGDIVRITIGSKVPADIRLIQCSDVKFDRSILTGESICVSGTIDATDINFLETRNIALQGTLCVEGSAIGIVVNIGDGTVFGRIAAQSVKQRPAKTTLEVEVSRFVLIIATLASITTVIIAITWAAWLRTSYPDFLNVSGLLIDCVSVFVAFIPEGLPICLTVSLSVIAGSMRKKNILCKSLATVETLGCVSVILSDKTGTLTQNRMSVVNVTIGTDLYSTQQAQDLSQSNDTTGHSIKVLASIASLCNDATFEKESMGESIEKRKINGDATDVGLLRFSESILTSANLRRSWTEVGKVAFNSKNKFALKLVRKSDTSSSGTSLILEADDFTEDDTMLLVKGAPDILIRRCSHFLNSMGTYSYIDESVIESITALQTSLAGQGQRIILLAKKIIRPGQLSKEVLTDSNLLQDSLISLNSDLIVIGMIALVDPPRLDTAETVRICRRAGIRFHMVTGDFALTGAAIARECGIITTQNVQGLVDLPRDTPLDAIPAFDNNKPEGALLTSLVLSGSDMISMTESQWKHTLAFDEIVFARTSPAQKLQIVKAFQSSGNTVAVTGDGVNDSPALKQADIGVALSSGSEVAMEAADLILLGEFSAITEGIKSGRLCFENLRKVILYLLPAGSFSELMPVLINIFFGLPQVLSNIQMILICTVTDVLPALSLCLEQPEQDLLLRKPRDRKLDRLADWKLLLHAYFFIGGIQSLTSMFGAFYFGFQQRGIPFSAMWLQYGNYNVDPDLLASCTANAQSIYFFNLVIMQWFNLLATRTRRLSLFQQNPLVGDLTKNYYLFPAMLIALGFAVFFSYVPLFQNIFGTQPIGVEYYFLPMAYGTVLLFLDESRKWTVRSYPKSFLAKIAW